ncbi:hypothetical protein C8F01DRAFT_1271472 [Mycena amicta]|nr:hypothetical protein C8F01DRAFT_1271472 [Mycena amicta]
MSSPRAPFRLTRSWTQSGNVIVLAASKEGDMLACGGSKGTAVWSTSGGNLEPISIPGDANDYGATTSLLFFTSVDFPAVYLFVGSQRGYVRGFLLLRESNKFVQHFTHQFKNKTGDITSLDFDAASKMLLAASTGDTIEIIKVALMQPMDPDRRKLEAVPQKSFTIKNFVPNVAVFDQLQPVNNRDIILFGLHHSGPVWRLSSTNGVIIEREALGGSVGSTVFDFERNLMLFDSPNSGATISSIVPITQTHQFRVERTAGAPTLPKKVCFAENAALAIIPSDHGAIYVFSCKTSQQLQKIQLATSGWIQQVSVTVIDGKTIIFAAESHVNGGDTKIFMLERGNTKFRACMHATMRMLFMTAGILLCLAVGLASIGSISRQLRAYRVLGMYFA